MLTSKSFETLFNVQSKSDYYRFSVNNNEINGANVFIAIVGERYNPLEHLEKLKKTTIKYIIAEKKFENNSFDDGEFEFIWVADITNAIAELGKCIASDFQNKNGTIVAISGSNGKTTTKEMLTHLLTQTLGEKAVIATQKNYNNHLGVPFTLFQINVETKIAVVELGSNAPGEIEFLAKMLKPHYAVTTNIGDTHLEFFGTRQAVLEEEASVHKFTQKIFFINNDDALLKSIKCSCEVKTFGQVSSDFLIEITTQAVKVNGQEFRNENIMGKHNFYNLACALSLAATITGEDLTKFQAASATFKPTFNRSQWVDWQNKKVFLDAYNANPSSMCTALDGFETFLKNHNIDKTSACVIVGDMNELGENSAQYHKEVGNYVLDKKFGKTIFIGRFANLLAGDRPELSNNLANVVEHQETIKQLLAGYKYLFIKGSRSLQLERILDIK